jgi:uncharacterized protein YkwD
LACVAMLALAPSAFAATDGGGGESLAETAPVARSLLAGLNRIRVEHRLTPLVANRRLAAAAREHSREMLAAGYFAHDSLDGTPFWRRVLRYYRRGSVGENLLWSAPDIHASTALEMWMASPPHTATILDPRWRDLGISVVRRAAVPGIYNGQTVTVVTADFGAPG